MRRRAPANGTRADLTAIASPIPAAPTQAVTAGKVQARTSTAIAIARLIGILGVVYVHGWTGLNWEKLFAANDSAQGVFRILINEIFGRSAVPLLSIISGWLVVSTGTTKSYGAFIGGKAKAILAPMILWNAIGIVAVAAGVMVLHVAGPLPTSFAWTFNELAPLLSPSNINVQMPFLRDLFVCMLFAPLLVRLPLAALIAVGAAAIVWTVSTVQFPLLLRPPILIFFVAGVALRKFGSAERVAAAQPWLLIAPFALLLGPKIALAVLGDPFAWAHPRAVAAFDVAFRLASALVLWRCAWALASGEAGRRLRDLEKYGFLLFCSHLIFMWVAAPLIGRIVGRLGDPLYPLFFLVQPALALGFAILVGRTLLAVSPPLAGILSGGRLTRKRDRSAASTISQASPAP